MPSMAGTHLTVPSWTANTPRGVEVGRRVPRTRVTEMIVVPSEVSIGSP